ncbi:Protein TOO MANY MOUTHS [Abeliophyllum distichum]|uniref:Protein TOO MANY MOUTHS n=1 Tax=Abeliophyllum distichum TaxID=126358 RepID=A0ABD1NY00_9LAMI
MSLSLHATILLILINTHLSMPFTVILPDSAQLEGPQPRSSMANSGAKTDLREQEAVYDIMRATGNGWATDIPDVCRGRWHGIECMPDKDNVYHVVSLSFGSLSDDTAFPTCDPTRSSISPSITKLPHLRTLFFYRCFSYNPQPIPSFLGRLGSDLQTLVLRENGHIGSIPYELGNLTRLKVLDLHNNILNGSIPVSLGRISGLNSLDLSGNQLSGSIPNLTFPVLSVLNLNQNHLSGSIPSTLLNLKFLLKIDLSHNRLSGPLPDINGLKELILLDLSYNSFTGPFPCFLKNLNSLQTLILNGNPSVSATIPNDGFQGLNNLIILVLSNMNLQGSIPESLGQLPKLRVLHLDRNQLNGSIPLSFSKLNGLSELRLNNNRLIGPVLFSREMIWRMRRKLRLNNNFGLCYDAKSGIGDDLDILFDAGIGHCDTPKPASTVPLQHISTGNEDIFRSSTKSAASLHKISLLSKIIQLSTIFLFVFCLL